MMVVWRLVKLEMVLGRVRMKILMVRFWRMIMLVCMLLMVCWVIGMLEEVNEVEWVMRGWVVVLRM